LHLAKHPKTQTQLFFEIGFLRSQLLHQLTQHLKRHLFVPAGIRQDFDLALQGEPLLLQVVDLRLHVTQALYQDRHIATCLDSV
jgi:hypothetical protein